VNLQQAATKTYLNLYKTILIVGGIYFIDRYNNGFYGLTRCEVVLFVSSDLEEVVLKLFEVL